ncbi:MAG: aminotransferase class IV [Deltaproteobacteria bacterium]|nr:aminotransferase class IV [Deltaproteobacteria bacterium]
MTKEFVWLNGKTVPADKALVPISDRGFNYGDGLFETIKAVEGEPLFLKEHLKRLVQGARTIRMDVRLFEPFIESINKGAIETLLKKNRLDRGEAYIKLLVTRGADTGGHLPSEGITPTTVIVARKIDGGRLAAIREKGISAITIEGSSPAIPGVKSLNYLTSVLAKMSADKKGAFESIFTDNSLVIEGSSTNVFAVKGGIVTTPPLASSLSRGPLPGIIRGEVKKLCKKGGIPFSEAPLSISALEKADEAFLTNSIIGIVPLVKVNRAKTGDGRPGPVTQRLQWLLEARYKKISGDSAP